MRERPEAVAGPSRTIGEIAHRGAAQGMVGTCPALSWASRAALSPASWVASSLGWKVPPGAAVLGAAALGAELEDDGAVVVEVV